MQKRFLSNLFLSLFLNFLIKPVSVLVIDAGVQRHVGNEAYGQYFALLSLTLITNIILDIGINNFTTRNIAQNQDVIIEHFSKIIGFRFVLFLLYSVVVFLAATLLQISLENFLILAFLMLNQFIIQLIAFFRSAFSGMHLFKTDTVISVLDRALLILLFGYFFVFYPQGINIQSFVIAQTSAYFITLLAAIIALNRKIRIKKLEWDWSYFISVLKKSAPYALLVLLMLIYNRSDSIILREWSENGDLEAGIYAQGFRLFDAMYMVGMIFAGMLFPLFSRMLFEKDPSLNDLLNTAAKLLIGGTMAAVFVLIVNGHEILSLIYKERVESSSFLVFCLLMLAMLSMSFNFVFGTLLTANGSLKSLNVISGVAALTSIGLNLLLVIPFGAIGSALAALIVQTVVSIAIVRIAVKRLQLLNLRLLALNLFGLFCFLVSGWAIISVSDFVALTPFLSIGIALTGIYVFRILNLNSFTKAFIKQEKRGN